MKKILNNIKNKIKSIMNKITHKNMWRLYLHYNNQLIKRLYISEDEQLLDKLYIVSVRGKKHLFGTNKKVTIVVKPICLKCTDKINKKVYVEVKEYEGVRFND